MKLDDPYPVLFSARSAVLLIFFMPLALNSHTQWASLTALAASLQTRLGDRVRVLRIDEANHPDVVRSFAIPQLPAFVLIQRGVELWRQVGLSDENTLIEWINGHLPHELTINQVAD